MRLKCIQVNTRALSFYGKQGWTVCGSGSSEEGAYYELAFPGDRRPR